MAQPHENWITEPYKLKNPHVVELLLERIDESVLKLVEDTDPLELFTTGESDEDGAVMIVAAYLSKAKADRARRTINSSQAQALAHRPKKFEPASFPPGNEPDLINGRQQYLALMALPRLWEVPGGEGSNVSILDIQRGWATNHPDLREVEPPSDPCVPSRVVQDAFHGTNGLSVMAARPNGQGMVGSAPMAKTIKLQGVRFRGKNGHEFESATMALYYAYYRTEPGDVVSIPYQTAQRLPIHNDWLGNPNNANNHARTIISKLAQKGVTVVEAAGNSGVYLTQGYPDVITVSAAAPSSTGWTSISNHGLGADCYAPANSLWALGVFYDGHAVKYDYGNFYSYSSAATNLLAGGLACLQSYAMRHFNRPIPVRTLKQLLQDSSSWSMRVDGLRGIPDFMRLRAMVG